MLHEIIYHRKAALDRLAPLSLRRSYQLYRFAQEELGVVDLSAGIGNQSGTSTR